MNNSPLAAFTLPIVIQTILSIKIVIIIGIPIKIIKSGTARIMYRSIDRLKLSAAFPLIFTQAESSFFER